MSSQVLRNPQAPLQSPLSSSDKAILGETGTGKQDYNRTGGGSGQVMNSMAKDASSLGKMHNSTVNEGGANKAYASNAGGNKMGTGNKKGPVAKKNNAKPAKSTSNYKMNGRSRSRGRRG